MKKKFRAITRGGKIFLRAGAYKPGTAEGVELLGHELVHVKQYLEGMSALDYLWHSRKGYYNNPYEIEAHRLENIIKADFCSKNTGASGC